MTSVTKERPILFSAPMVRALLDGRKTQTRRIVKPQPEQRENASLPGNRGTFTGNGWNLEVESARKLFAEYHCPYGKPGDRLWVRETYRETWGSGGETHGYKFGGDYRADGKSFSLDTPSMRYGGDINKDGGVKWRPSIFMPRICSRITLEITDVRVQRLQDISEEDAITEGLYLQIGDTKAGHMWNGPGYHDHVSFDRHGRTYHVARAPGVCICHAGTQLKLSPAKCAYRILFESINGAGSWDANPWVWALTFRRMEDGKAAVA